MNATIAGIDMLLYAGAGALLAYIISEYIDEFKEQKAIRTAATERQAHKMLLSEDTSVEEINAILDKLEQK